MSEHKREDRAAWEGEMFRLLVKNIEDYAIFIVDPQGCVESWSHGAERLLGYREDEIVGQSADRFYIPEDVRDDVPRAEMHEAETKGRGYDDRWHVRNDSSRFWASGVMTALRDEAGRLRGFAKIMRDRTGWWLAEQARHEVEARKTAILETAIDCIISIDHDGKVIEFNPSAEQTFGYSRTEALGRELAELIIPPTLRDRHRQGLAHYLATGEATVLGKRIEITGMRADATEFPVELAITRISTEGPPVFTAYIRDISERKRQEASISEQKRLAEFGRDIGLALTQSASLGEMLSRIAALTVASLDGAFARIWTTNETGDLLELKASAGLYTQLDGSHASVSLGQNKIGKIAQERKPHLTNAVIGDPSVPNQDWAEREGMTAFAGYPLVIEDRLVGVWAMFARHPLSDITLEAMASVADGIAVGIEQRRAEVRLNEQREWLRVTLASIGDAVIATDTEGRVTFLNPVAEVLTGWSQPDADGRALEEVFRIVNEKTRQTVESPATRALREGTIVGLANHTLLIARDGTEWPIDDSAAPIKNETGRVVGVVLIFREVVERRAAERRRNARLAVTQVLAEAKSLEEAAPRILQAACEGLGWDMGALWTLDEKADALRCLDLWSRSSVAVGQFSAASRSRVFARDVGLPGRVWSLGRALWIPDVTIEPLPRSPIAREEGLHGAFAAPILLGETFLGVIEFYSGEVREPDPDLLEMMATLAGQIGQFIERKRAEEHLREQTRIAEMLHREAHESAERFRNLAGAMPQIVWIARPDLTIEFYNERWFEYTGLSPEESYEPEGWSTPVHPDDIARIIEASTQSQASGEPFEAEYRLRDRHGAYRWHLGRAVAVLDERSQVVRRFGTATDIDDRKRTENAARFLSEASATLATLVDEASTFQKVANLAVPSFADWCSVDMAGDDGNFRRLAVAHVNPAKVEYAHDLQRRYPPDPDAPNGVPQVIRTGKPSMVAEITDEMLVEGAKDEGHLQILRDLGLRSYMCVPLKGRAGTLGAISFVAAESGRSYGPDDLRLAEDLGRRAAIAIENARLYGELKETDRLKNEFLATLAHELRNPLAPIRNTLHLMRRPGGHDPMEEERAMAERQVVHLARLIDDLMDAARISRGRIELRKEVVDLGQVVNQAVETARPSIEERRHQLTVHLPERAVRLEADPTRLEQVLWNLLNNAAKYSHPGGRIDLIVEPEGAEVVLRVRDTGIGIKPEMLPRIFEMFVQVSDHRDHAQGGLGIGLSLVRTLVEMHGGSIVAQSRGPGLGSEFVVRLPALAQDREVESAASHRRETDDQPSRRRILVVDDNVDAAKSLARLLVRLYGQEVRVAHDGLEALTVAEEFDPEVVLLDIGLPGMSGYEVAERLRRQPEFKRTLIVALTGWGQEDDRRRSLESGIDRHLVKPVNPEALRDLLAGIETRER